MAARPAAGAHERDHDQTNGRDDDSDEEQLRPDRCREHAPIVAVRRVGLTVGDVTTAGDCHACATTSASALRQGVSLSADRSHRPMIHEEVSQQAYTYE
jgi:hypothetical protein